jgi:hypothetical protein
MNCKPGDLAIVVSCRNAPENIGAIRQCVAVAHGWIGWEIDRPLPNGDDCICDTCVRPLRPGPDEQRDETLIPKCQLENA